MLQRLWIVMLAAALFAPLGAHAAAPAWTIDPARSSLTFDGTAMGAPFTGAFKKFGGQIVFDPNDLSHSYAAITIDITTVDAKDDDRNKYIGTKDWFDSAAFPIAIFKITRFEKTAADKYIAHGQLTLRDVTRPVDLPFTLEISSGADGHKIAKMHGDLALNRLDFGIGNGEWRNPKTVGPSVTVHVAVTATQTK